MSTTKKIPMRKCVGCQEMKNKKEMLRVLKTAEGEFILDATGRKNGRGAYLCFSGKCLQEAIKNKGLERSLNRRYQKRYTKIWKRSWSSLNINRALSMISLATKAGKTKSGEFMTEKEVKEGRAHLVIVADDASDNTKKKFQNMCDFYKVPIYFFEDKDTLGHAMGKEFRASLAVTDAGFAKGIRKHLDMEEG